MDYLSNDFDREGFLYKTGPSPKVLISVFHLEPDPRILVTFFVNLPPNFATRIPDLIYEADPDLGPPK